MATIIQFTVGDPDQPAPGEVSYNSTALAGRKIKVYREGLYQYNQKGVNYIINSNSGRLFFIPGFVDGERIRIQTVE